MSEDKVNYTGNSMSSCFRDILSGKVLPEQVERIISSTRIPDLNKGISELHSLKKNSTRGWQEIIEEVRKKNRGTLNYLEAISSVLLEYKRCHWRGFEWEKIMDLFLEITIEQPRLELAPNDSYMAKRVWDPELPLKEVIEIYFDPNAIKSSQGGAFRARLKKDHKVHSAGIDIESAVDDLLLTLKSFDKPSKRDFYSTEIIDVKTA